MEEQDTERSLEKVLQQAAAADVVRVQTCTGPHMHRSEAPAARRFLLGRPVPVARTNDWQMAEEPGERGPRGAQRLVGN